MSKASNYINMVKVKANKISSVSIETNKYKKAAKLLFDSLSESKLEKKSAGDKHFIANNYQKSVSSAFESLDFKVYSSPKISLKSGKAIPAKFFDLLVSNSENNRHLLIEVKSSTGGFNGLAAALLAIIISRKAGISISAGNGAEIEVNNKNIKYILLIGTECSNDLSKFDELRKIFLPRSRNVEAFAIYPQNCKDDRANFEEISKFIRKQAGFLLNLPTQKK